jgi:hypothetical protein
MAIAQEIEVQVSTQVLAAKSKANVEELDQLQDLYCSLTTELTPKINEIKIKQKELEGIEKLLQAGLDASYGEAEDGNRSTDAFIMQYSAKGKATVVVDKKALVEALGLGTFIELAEITLENLKKHLTTAQQQTLLKEVYKNKRRLKFAPKS